MTQPQKVELISHHDFHQLLEKLLADSTYEIVGVKSKGERFVFDHLESADELRLEYDVTLLPPKKLFLPPIEPMMSYNLEKNFEVNPDQSTIPRIIIGMHPYDIIALEQTDMVYLDEQQDTFYKNRRENTLIIGVDIQTVSERSFAGSMNTHITDSGFDLMLTNLGKQYAITIGSEQGANLLQSYGAKTSPAKDRDIKKITKIREELPKKYTQQVTLSKDQWGDVLLNNYDHNLWDTQSKRCLECSSCTMVCPTCFCYDVQDKTALDLKDGTRIRTWDGCLLRDFTKIGSGEVFRDDISERYRHRFYRKGSYLYDRYGFVACVGCGRCGNACLPDIADPCKVMNELAAAQVDTPAAHLSIEKKSAPVTEQGTIHVPRKATIIRKEPLTDNETFFEIRLDDNKSLGHQPGQFIELSIFGVGEAPISISSAPTEKPTFELIVRKVGNVTSKLFSLQKGDTLGVRGPFGNGFDIESLKGKDIIFVCAGLGVVPIRSLINYVMDDSNRDQFNDIKILYGCKLPAEVLLPNELERWKTCEDTECMMTVDTCPDGECWEGEVGLITSLFPKIEFDPSQSKDTMIVLCGPPIVYKFVIQILKDMKIPDENIQVSLERRMKCGVGKCGHCQINGVYVCKEGPVFSYDQVKHLPEAFS